MNEKETRNNHRAGLIGFGDTDSKKQFRLSVRQELERLAGSRHDSEREELAASECDRFPECGFIRARNEDKREGRDL